MKQHRQSDQGRTTPGRNHATQPGGPGAVPTHPREMGDKAAPGTYCGWDPGTEYTAWDRIRDERRAEREEREHYHDDWKHKDRGDA